jgi:hypothetical protein
MKKPEAKDDIAFGGENQGYYLGAKNTLCNSGMYVNCHATY